MSTCTPASRSDATALKPPRLLAAMSASASLVVGGADVAVPVTETITSGGRTELAVATAAMLSCLSMAAAMAQARIRRGLFLLLGADGALSRVLLVLILLEE